MFAMFATWLHPEEQSRLSLFTLSGSCLGNILGQTVAGAMASSSFLGGWPSPFYLFGTCGLLWCVLWICLVYDTPGKHPRISLAEKQYIESGTKIKAAPGNVPWAKIVTSFPVWAICIAHLTVCWSYFTLLTNLPLYMNRVLLFDLTTTGLLSSLPYVIHWIGLVLAGIATEHIINGKVLSRTTTRKMFTTGGSVGVCITLLLVAAVGCNSALSVAFISLNLGFIAICFGGYLPNTLDLAPAYPGVIAGAVQTTGLVAGIIGPYLVGVLTTDQRDILGWQKVFFVSSGVMAFGGIFYAVFASGEKQSWADDHNKEGTGLTS